jgi:hypothetical protein
MRIFIGLAVALVGLSMTAGGTAVAQDLVFCSREHEYCRVPYPTQVIYGVPGRSRSLEVGGPGVPCNNEVFGDPAPGVPKRCVYVARRFEERRGRGWDGPGRDRGRGAQWRTCAPENGVCRWEGVRRVRYGVPGRFVEGTYRNGVRCSNSVFGDPAPGRPKVCQVLD